MILSLTSFSKTRGCWIAFIVEKTSVKWALMYSYSGKPYPRSTALNILTHHHLQARHLLESLTAFYLTFKLSNVTQESVTLMAALKPPIKELIQFLFSQSPLVLDLAPHQHHSSYLNFHQQLA